MPRGPQRRWLAATIIFGPAVFVAGAALGDWVLKPSHGWIGAQLLIIFALLIGQWFYRKRILNAQGG